MNSYYISIEEFNKLNPEHILVSICPQADVRVDTLDCIKALYRKEVSNIEMLDLYLEDVEYDLFKVIILKDNKFVVADIIMEKIK